MDPNQNQPQNQSSGSPSGVSSILVILLILTLIATGGLYFLINRTAQPEQVSEDQVTAPLPTFPIEEVTPTLTPSPKPIAHGKSGFLISLGSNVKGPRMGKVDIDPYDPELNSLQKITVEVVDKDNPVNKVYATLTTDNRTSPRQELKLISGTVNSGNWEAMWTVGDTYLYNYVLTLEAVSLSGTSSVNITLR